MGELIKETTKKLLNKPKSKKRYINNRQFFDTICQWQDQLVIDPKTPMPNYLGECFMKLAENLGHKTSYNTLLDDMKSHAVFICVLYCKNFDRTKSENPFSYFTSYINNAFAGFYNSEKKLIELKFNMLKELGDGEEYDYRDNDNGEY